MHSKELLLAFLSVLFLLLTWADLAEAWLLLLGGATAAAIRTTDLDCWCLRVD
ncbi:rCG63448 [Rattus norvegicus]|uniref:RCG63448 n=1 Tax=Rattus norvegicus TaxID=10116 RepID=A6HBM0_RAT|nr:rCG63448 [Rattus norvegicus]